MKLTHEFVEYIPDKLRDGTLYISISFATAVHRCCCGCGNEVVTPISPTDWTLLFDGETVSLDPSIGNWNFSCQSHYWIKRNVVIWARQWSVKEIAAGRAHERVAKQRRYDNGERGAAVTSQPAEKPAKRWWRKLTMWF